MKRRGTSLLLGGRAGKQHPACGVGNRSLRGHGCFVASKRLVDTLSQQEIGFRPMTCLRSRRSRTINMD